MKAYKLFFILLLVLIVNIGFSQSTFPIINNVFISNIAKTSVTINWTTDINANEKVRWLKLDSVSQPIIFTDSIYSTNLQTSHFLTITNLNHATIYACNVSSTNNGNPSTSGILYFSTQSNSTGEINVYYNHSIDSSKSIATIANGNINFSEKLIKHIDSTKHSIDITAYSFANLFDIFDALKKAKNRGVAIRFIYDSRPNTSLVDSLLSIGVHMQKRNYDTTSGHIMHDKFWIFDYRYNHNDSITWLWTGSTNVTQEQFVNDRNNVIEIQDRSLAGAYTREFEQMWGSHKNTPNNDSAKFGTHKKNIVPHDFTIGGTKIELYFSPYDTIGVKLGRIVSHAKHKVNFCIYGFTSMSISDSLYAVYNFASDANNRNVKGVFDHHLGVNPTTDTVYRSMKGISTGINWNPPADVYLDYNTGSALLHHKYIIIDEESSDSAIIETGSFNYTITANNYNDENALIIHSSDIANQYYQEFSSRYLEASGHPLDVSKSSTNENSFMLYPNPTTGNINLTFRNQKIISPILQIYNSKGKLVFSEEITDKNNIDTFYTDISELSSGIYFFKVNASTDNSQEVFKGKIIISR